MNNLQNLLKSVDAIFKNGQIPDFIEQIRFPFFKSLKENTKIDFTYPLTIFVGSNGSGKSSVLRALAGSPEGDNLGNYWFSTAIDPIEEAAADGKRHCFIYSYDKGKEVLYQRASRPGTANKAPDPDYWETAKPSSKYGMNKDKRHAPIKKDVVYIDFRGELSAFDKYFYFDEPGKNLKAKSKQDYLRDRSKRLKGVLDNKKGIYKNSKSQRENDKLINFETKQIEKISEILGKNYKSGSMIEHKFFNSWGYSIVFETEHRKYSEAHAGSGEVAVARAVYKIMNAKEGSLILLDEPEVSLHPAAQEQLKVFLLEQIKNNKHQIILCTHSPTLVDKLPEKAIKVFNELPNGTFQVFQDVHFREAFLFIGHRDASQIQILVEDTCAKKIIEAVINKIGTGQNNNHELFNVDFGPGGESVLKNTYIPTYMYKKDVFVIFDGDQLRDINDQEFSSAIYEENENKLKALFKKLLNTDVKPIMNSNDSSINFYKTYFEFWKSNVFFLPKDIPENIIWDSDGAREFAKFCQIDYKEPRSSMNTKEKFANLVQQTSIKSNYQHYEAIIDFFITRWIEKNTTDYDAIENILKTLRKN